MNSKLRPILLIVLILLNGVLIFMLVKKPHENRQHQKERSFLTEQLNFSEAQKIQFIDLDIPHRNFMMKLDKEIAISKEVLFNSFSNENFNSDEIVRRIGDLEAKKEAEVFRFFSKVRVLCTENQAQSFDKIIKKALKGGKRKPPRGRGENHPPKEERN
jgi:hypothetical protein